MGTEQHDIILRLVIGALTKDFKDTKDTLEYIGQIIDMYRNFDARAEAERTKHEEVMEYVTESCK